MYAQRTGYKNPISVWQSCNTASLATNQPTNQPHTFPHFLLSCNKPQNGESWRGGSVWIKSAALLTVRSGLSLSRWFTARMTPDLQGHRSMSPISGGSSPLTQRNRFPTSSGRASTAMALAGPNPPLKKLPNQRHPESLVIYDIKPASWGESNTRKKIKKNNNEKSLQINGEKKPTRGI